jgi:carbonic anhydrase
MGQSQLNRWTADARAGLVVFLVALPFCLGIPLASGSGAIQPSLFSGILAGIVGGIVVGSLSGSHTSVSGPAAGLTAIVAAQLAALGSFEAFLAAVVIAGVMQILLGIARAGFLAAFFPSSVIKGLLAAIGLILILKQIPHLFGHDADPDGEMSFQQLDHENTFSELGEIFFGIHPGAAIIGLLSIAVLVIWDRNRRLKALPIPAPLAIVVLGVVLSEVFRTLGGSWLIEPRHLVDVPIAGSLTGLVDFFAFPDFTVLGRSQSWLSAFTIAVVASLETLLNVGAVDRIDPYQRTSPPSRELMAQGVGNIVCGLIGALPVTSVVVRSTVNVTSGVRTRASTFMHGFLLLACVTLMPSLLNRIPLSCLAAILIVTGFKLVSPALVRQMWQRGRYRFVPFIVTVAAIVITDLLVGILIGLAVALSFILRSNFRRPLRRFVERHVGADVLRIELGSQVSFLNRPALDRTLNEVPRGGHVLLDGRRTDYLDPDVLDMIRDFRIMTAPAHGVTLSLMGFRSRFDLPDQILYQDFASQELQSRLAPGEVLAILKEGNQRFRSGRMLTRDYGRQVTGTAQGQHPLAVVLSCIDSRTPAEPIFDLGLGDIFSIRIAGNGVSQRVLGSMEYGCSVAKSGLIVVMGHTRCGAVTAAVNLARSGDSVSEATGCDNLDSIVADIQASIPDRNALRQMSDPVSNELIDEIAARNVHRTMGQIFDRSERLRSKVQDGTLQIVGCLYDVAAGNITWFDA